MSAVGKAIFLCSVLPLSFALRLNQKEGWGEKPLYLLHIAKTAGTSALYDIPDDHLPKNAKFSEGEVCHDNWRMDDARRIAFLRNPRAHVISQYYHCDMDAHLNPKVEIFNPQNWPAKPNLWAWLDHWGSRLDKFNADRAAVRERVKAAGDQAVKLTREQLESESLKDEDTFHCYLPANLQTRHMSCKEREYPFPSEDRRVIANLNVYGGDKDTALNNLKELAYVGITELYQESLCVIHAGELNEVPENCNCENEAAWKTFHQKKFDHGVSHSHPGVDQLAAGTNKILIDKLTEDDWELYVAGVRRFKEEAKAVEQKFGKKIICDDAKIDALMSKEASAHPMSKPVFFKYDMMPEDASSHFK